MDSSVGEVPELAAVGQGEQGKKKWEASKTDWKKEQEQAAEDSVLLSLFEVNRMKAIAVAIKQGADAQRESHEKQVSRLEAEVAVLRSERNLLRKKAEAPENKRGIGPKQAFTTYNFSALTQEVKRLTMQLSEEAAVLMHDIQRELLDNVHLIPL